MAARTPTNEDGQRAARKRRSDFLTLITKMSDRDFSNLVRQNRSLLIPFLKEADPKIFETKSAKRSLDLTREAMKNISASVLEQIAVPLIGIENAKPKNSTQKPAKQDVKNSKSNNAASKNFVSAFTSLTITGPQKTIRGLYGTVSGLALTGSGLNETLVKPIIKVANGLINLTPSPAKTRATLAGIFALGGASAMMMEVDSAPYLPQMGVQNVFKAACTPYVLKSSASNVAYTLNFNSTAAGSIEKHTHDTMMMANRHGAPAMALHLISYLESMKFTDMKANNSTASNPFQVIDSTKMLYIKSYGQDTFLYQDAQSRINTGLASTMDIALVGAIDAVSTIPMEQLNKMIADQKYPGYVHDAKTLADVSAMSAELVVLDMLKSVPEIANPNLTPDEIVKIVAQYYTKEHFLGVGNYNMFQTVAAKQPNLSITDVKGMTAAFGAKMAENFLGIVKRNPGLLEDGMTAAEALQNITAKFEKFVGPELRKFSTVYAPGLTTYEQCLSDEAIAMNLPRTIPRWKAISYSWGKVWEVGVAPHFINAADEKKKLKKEETAAKQNERQPEPAPS